MTVDNPDSRAGPQPPKRARGRAADPDAVEKPAVAGRALVEFASMRLRQKLMVRRAIGVSPARKDPVRQGTASRGGRRS